MRIRFRTKLLLSLVLTLALLLAGALVAVDRISAARIDGLIDLRATQGLQSFKVLTERRQRGLLRSLRWLATAPRLRAALVEAKGTDEAGQEALYEISLRQVEMDLLVVADARGKPLARYLNPAGERKKRGAEAKPASLPIAAGAVFPEAPLIRAVLAEADPETLNPFLVCEDRLFLAVAFQVRDLDEPVGVLVLGVEIDDDEAMDYHALQSEADQVAYVLGDRLQATSFVPGVDRTQAAFALKGRMPPSARDEAIAVPVQIGAEPFRAVVKAIHPESAEAGRSIHIAQFVSLRTLVDFRDQMRNLTITLALVGLIVALGVSMVVARQVSAPVQDLERGAVRIARGEYSYRLVPRSRDELGDLAKSFNSMAGDLESKEKVRAVLNKVVAKEVAEELLRSDLGLSGRNVEATLLFADLRGFTGLTRGMAPEEIVKLLNEYMTAMSAEILAGRGIVDKYVGDEIIGVFGAPRSYGNDAFAAVESAFRMKARLVGVNEVRRRRGEPALAMGIGVHTGPVVAGCMGSEDLLSYTCIGEAVNLASRLCASAAPGQILVSAETCRAAGEGVEARSLPPLTLKGFAQPVPVFDVVRVTAPIEAPQVPRGDV